MCLGVPDRLGPGHRIVLRLAFRCLRGDRVDDLPVSERGAVPTEVGGQIPGGLGGLGADNEPQAGPVEFAQVDRGEHPGVGDHDHPGDVVAVGESPDDRKERLGLRFVPLEAADLEWEPMDHAGPGGETLRVGRSTLDRWVRAHRQGGFDALVPAPRAGVSRVPASVLDLAVALKTEAPARSAVLVAQILAESGRGGASRRTIQRHFARLGLNTRPDGAAAKVYGRFETATRNDLWTGDAMQGPVVAGRKTYLLAFIDDHVRHEAPCNRVEVKGLHRRAVAAA